MRVKGNGLRSIILIIWACFFTAVTFIFGAVPLHALYRLIGRPAYWLMSLGISLMFVGFKYYFMALSFFVVSAVIGIFNEFKQRGKGVLNSGLLATFFISTLIWSGMYFWVRQTGSGWLSLLELKITEYLTKMLAFNKEALEAISAKDIIVQIPSAVVMILMVSLLIAVVFEKTLYLWIRKPFQRRELLTSFKMPEWCIWLFIASLLGAFIKTDIEIVNWFFVNLFNVVTLLYSFQGLAVAVKFFEIFKVGVFWRVFFLTMVVLQFYQLIVVVGVMDYWFNFREKLIKRTADNNKSNL